MNTKQAAYGATGTTASNKVTCSTLCQFCGGWAAMTPVGHFVLPILDSFSYTLYTCWVSPSELMVLEISLRSQPAIWVLIGLGIVFLPVLDLYPCFSSSDIESTLLLPSCLPFRLIWRIFYQSLLSN